LNCAEFNEWDGRDKLRQSKHALKGSAGQILEAESGREWTFDELVVALRKVFGDEGQSTRYRTELNTRRQLKGDTLQSFAQEMRRLVALAYEDSQSKTPKDVCTDSFIKGIDDWEVANKVREHEPKDLDDPLKQAMRFEAYAQSRAIELMEAGARRMGDEGGARTLGPAGEFLEGGTNEREWSGTSLNARDDCLITETVESKINYKEGCKTYGGPRKRPAEKFLPRCHECGELGHRQPQCKKKGRQKISQILVAESGGEKPLAVKKKEEYTKLTYL